MHYVKAVANPGRAQWPHEFVIDQCYYDRVLNRELGA
jgi:hypothetical protein